MMVYVIVRISVMGEGNGNGDGKCKKVTISIFQAEPLLLQVLQIMFSKDATILSIIFWTNILKVWEGFLPRNL